MSSTTAATNRSTKIKAMLAGGLVLGIGAAVTLASWTDQAYVNAEFGTSEFNIQVSTDGGNAWAEADEDGGTDASTLAFSVDFTDALQPGNTVYAPLDLQTDEGSVAGTVTLQGASQVFVDDEGEGEDASTTEEQQRLFDALTYTVTELDEEVTCGPDATGTPLVPGVGLATGSEPGAISLGADGADAKSLCFAVTLPEGDEDTDLNDLQGLSTSALWRFAAESVDNV